MRSCEFVGGICTMNSLELYDAELLAYFSAAVNVEQKIM